MRGGNFIGVGELAARAAGILSESGLVQERGTVTELPDERTVRYYISEGLLSPAEDKQGTASVFGYVHLLQLLVIKKLQAEHLPIRKIKELVAGRTERELERLLGAGSSGGRKNEALDYLESLLTSPRAGTSPQVAKGSSRPAAMFSQPAPPIPAQQSTAASWERVEVEPGLELHVRSDYSPPRDAGAVNKLAHSIVQIISRKPGKRGR